MATRYTIRGEVGNEVHNQSVSVKLTRPVKLVGEQWWGKGQRERESTGYLELDKSIFKDSENQM